MVRQAEGEENNAIRLKKSMLTYVPVNSQNKPLQYKPALSVLLQSSKDHFKASLAIYLVTSFFFMWNLSLG